MKLYSNDSSQCNGVLVFKREHDILSCDDLKVLEVFVAGDTAFNTWTHLSHRATERPMVHDLLWAVMQQARQESAGGWSLLHAAITELRGSVFIGRLFFGNKHTGEVIWECDCRPSDGCYLSLKAGCPFLVHRQVWEQAAMPLRASAAYALVTTQAAVPSTPQHPPDSSTPAGHDTRLWSPTRTLPPPAGLPGPWHRASHGAAVPGMGWQPLPSRHKQAAAAALGFPLHARASAAQHGVSEPGELPGRYPGGDPPPAVQPGATHEHCSSASPAHGGSVSHAAHASSHAMSTAGGDSVGSGSSDGHGTQWLDPYLPLGGVRPYSSDGDGGERAAYARLPDNMQLDSVGPPPGAEAADALPMEAFLQLRPDDLDVIMLLKRQLALAISEEDYAAAARIRDHAWMRLYRDVARLRKQGRYNEAQRMHAELKRQVDVLSNSDSLYL